MLLGVPKFPNEFYNDVQNLQIHERDKVSLFGAKIKILFSS